MCMQGGEESGEGEGGKREKRERKREEREAYLTKMRAISLDEKAVTYSCS